MTLDEFDNEVKNMILAIPKKCHKSIYLWLKRQSL